MAGAPEGDSPRLGWRGARLASVAGPILTAVTLLGFEVLAWAGVRVPHFAPVCLTMVAFSAFVGGLAPGLVSAGLTIAYVGLQVFGGAGQLPGFSPFDNLALQIALLITAPLVALMVGVLKDWHRAAVLTEIREGLAERELRIRETDALLEIARVVGGITDLEEALRLICRQLQRLTGADTVAAYTLAPDGTELRPTAAYRVPKDRLARLTAASLPLAEASTLTSGVMGDGSTAWTSNAPADPRFGFTLFRAVPHQSAIAVPLVLDARVSGAFYLVWWTARNEPSREQLATLRSVGQQVGLLLRSARLYAETRQNLAGAALLNEAGRTLHRTLDVRRLLPDALAALGQTLGASGTAVALFASSQAPAVFRWGDVADDAAIALAGPLRKREAPILTAEAADRSDGATAVWPGGRTAAAFPLRGRAQLLGALCLWFPQQRPLPEFESRLLSAYADQLAMALENTTLFEEAENKRTQLEQVFASTSDGFLVVDLDGRVLGLNARGAHLLGVTPREMIGATASQLVEATRDGIDWNDGGARVLADLFRAPDAGAGDLEVRTGAGSRTVGWRAAPTRDLLGTAVGLTVTLRDVTREREVDRMKTDVVSVVSHELRTPLASIRGSLQLLMAEPEVAGNATRRTLLEISIKNTDRLTRLINDILDVSRIEAGRIQLHRERHRPEAFVAVAVDGIAAVAASRGVAIERAMAPGLPPVLVDFDRLVQVMTNLLSNAIAFSPPGQPVRVSAARAGGEIELSVTDQGPGIAPGDLAKLFQKFHQLDGEPGRRGGGSGLGLAICRGIVEEHGGRISVESRPGAGTSFIVHLSALDEPTAPAPSQPPRAEAPLILVVDDEPDLREVLRDMFITGGFQVMEAGRALEAVELARRHRPDLITMDVMLPDLDGFEAVRILREAAETRDTPVIMVSGVELDPDTVKPLGSTALLTKPFTETALFAAVRGQLAERGEGPR